MRLCLSYPFSILSLSVFPLVLCLPTDGHNEQHEDGPLVKQLYQYPLGTWLENIAVRPSGELLVTLLNKPALHQVDPFETNPTPQRVHYFSDVSSLTGIAEIAPDLFAVAVGNFSLTSGGEKGSWSIRNVVFHAAHQVEADIHKIADVPQGLFLNGMCALPTSRSLDAVLVGDVDQGVIRRVDTTTGDVSVAVKNKLTAVAPDPVFGGSTGVNGIHIKDGTLYLVNVAKSLFASLPIHPDGTPAGESIIIRKVQKPEQVFYFDDFAIKGDDAYLVTGTGNSVERIGLDGTPKGRIIAGDLNSTQIAGPTSAAFGRTEKDSHVLYVVTSGALAAPVNGKITIGAQILAIDTKKWPW